MPEGCRGLVALCGKSLPILDRTVLCVVLRATVVFEPFNVDSFVASFADSVSVLLYASVVKPSLLVKLVI